MPDTDARKAWLAAHRDELRAYHRDWSAKHRARIKEYADARKAKDPEGWAEQTREKTRGWRERHPLRNKVVACRSQKRQRAKNPTVFREKQQERLRKWRKENPAANQAIHARRDAAKRNAHGAGISRDEWTHTLECFGGRCAYCAAPAKLTMDHVQPISKHGAHSSDNVVPACKSCNSRKHDRNLLQWLALDALARGR